MGALTLGDDLPRHFHPVDSNPLRPKLQSVHQVFHISSVLDCIADRSMTMHLHTVTSLSCDPNVCSPLVPLHHLDPSSAPKHVNASPILTFNLARFWTLFFKLVKGFSLMIGVQPPWPMASNEDPECSCEDMQQSFRIWWGGHAQEGMSHPNRHLTSALNSQIKKNDRQPSSRIKQGSLSTKNIYYVET